MTSRPALHSKVMLVTPDLALQFLENNHGNRRLRPHLVEFIASAIRRGEYKLTHQGIAFDSNGRLLDGQHRLHAIIAAGIAVPMMVTENVESDAFSVMDQGERRSMADLAGIDRRVVEPCFLAASLAHGTRRASFQQVAPILNGPIGSTVIDLISFCPTSRRFFSSAPVKLAATLIALRSREDRDYAFATYRALLLCDFDSMSRAAYALFRQVQSGGANAVNTHDTLARAMVVFNKERSSLSEIRVGPQQRTAVISRVKSDLRAELGLKDNADPL